MATIVIGADICPIEENLPYFTAGDANVLFNDLLPEFQNADISIANLECPLIEEPTPIEKTGPIFGESSACINGIKNAGINVLCLANNHILDHGGPGLKNTIKVCAAAGIDTVGAGENLSAARQMLIKTVGTIRVGILAVAEHEFSIAGKNSWGANPIDIIDFVRNVKENQSRFDFLVVLLHGSAEFHVPTPRIRDTCRFMVEMGAGAVIVQHPHCLGGCETYKGGHIVYGQGALVMDEAVYRDLHSFHESFLVKLIVRENGGSDLEIIPFIQSAPAPGAKRMEKAAENAFLEALARKSDAVQDDSLVESEWLRFCQHRKNGYLSALLGHNRFIRKLNFRGIFTRLFYQRRALLGVKNVVSCETHREAIQTLFSKDIFPVDTVAVNLSEKE